MSRKFVNTNYFRERALHFLEHGYYCGAIEGTREYWDYWEEERKRCLEGYSVGGMHITGYHYFYLNYCEILRVDASHLAGDRERKGVSKVQTFPAFWDGDYDYFWALEIARNGVTPKFFKELDLGIHIREKDLVGGKHLVVLKARGKGYSYKAGAMLARNFNLGRKSKNFAFAEEKEFLIKDGILNKAWDNISFIDNNTPFSQPTLRDGIMHKQSGYKKNVKGNFIELGTKNEIMGVTIKDDPDKARGKRGELILFEEAGKCPGLLKAWEVCRPSVEQGALTTGIQIAYGTGGTDEAQYEGLEELFYFPEANNVLPIENMWDEGAMGTFASFFVPAYQNWEGFTDADGNSDVYGAKAYLEHQRSLKKQSKDNKALEQFTCENPFSPQEATLQVSSNLFPTAELTSQLNSVKAHKRHLTYSNGILYRNAEGKVQFRIEDAASPIFDYPLRKGNSEKGCISILESPYRDDNGAVPQGLYIICHDPYAVDKTQTSPSLGSAFVIKRSNNLTTTLDNCIVASYVGRPETQDEYNRNLFMLAEYYNCKIGFENDRGDVIGFGKRFNLLHYLEEEFEMLDKRELQSRRVNRPYGMHMTEGRKSQGEVYIRDWLNEPISFVEDGPTKLRLHTILDPALLQELIKFNRTGNFDRVMSLMIGMYYIKELHNASVTPRKSSVVQEFFERPLFQ